MKGQQHIYTMRSQGLQPDWVFINDFPCPTDWSLFDDFATICTEGYSITSLDLRFLVDCRVSIVSTSESRAKALYKACKPYALMVSSSVIDPNSNPRKQTGWSKQWQR